LAGETILVIDDTEDTRDFIVKYVLEPAGYRILTAKDGEEGLRVALQHRPDLILLDMNMPRLDGKEVLKRLQAEQIESAIIFMTAHGSEDVAIEVHRMGVRDYLRKPFYPEELLDSVDKSLTEGRLRKEKEALTRRVLQSNIELQHRVQELNILYTIGKSVTALLPMHQLLPRIVDAAIQMTHADEGYLILLDIANGKLICKAQKRHHNSRAIAASDDIRDPLALHIIQTNQALVFDMDKLKALTGSVPAPLSGGIISAAYAPLTIKDKVIGALGVRNTKHESGAFAAHHAALLSALSDYAAIAVENARHSTSG
jgi:DNA-binding response OmpR family regulator